MIKPDWKLVSVLQNMTYEEWGERPFNERVFVKLKTTGEIVKCVMDSFFVFPYQFDKAREDNSHIYFHKYTGGTLRLSDITHYAILDIAPPEEE